jgi:predicted transcriptional regulator
MGKGRLLLVNPYENPKPLLALSSELRLKIFQLLREKPMNVREISQELDIPASTAATNVAILEDGGLIATTSKKAVKGSQKVCHAEYDEILVTFEITGTEKNDNVLEMQMPIGLYTNFQVTPPCGLCSVDSIIGYLDVPAAFHEAERVKAGLIWFQSGYVEYKFPNNLLYDHRRLKQLEFVMELSSEVPGTNKNWPSDISVTINDIEIGQWTSPGDFGDRRGEYTPDWWKLEGSQYGLLKTWRVTNTGSYVDGVRISDVCLKDLKYMDHHSFKIKIEVKENAEHMGGVNIFGKGFGNYGRDILLRLVREEAN